MYLVSRKSVYFGTRGQSVFSRAAIAIVIAIGFLQVEAKKQSAIPGEQLIIAKPIQTAPTIDGVVSEGEYDGAGKVKVKFDKPDTAQGIIPSGIPFLLPPDSQHDLSFEVLTSYDDLNLYVAVVVKDDILWDDSVKPWRDDAVEIFIDADNVANDLALRTPGKEGFQIIMDIGGGAFAADNGEVDWEAAPGLDPQGYVIEFRISLLSLDVIDGPGEASPAPGSTFGFNVAVGDDDNGGESYGTPGLETDSYGAWDGSSPNWNFSKEQDFGTILLKE